MLLQEVARQYQRLVQSGDTEYLSELDLDLQTWPEKHYIIYQEIPAPCRLKRRFVTLLDLLPTIRERVTCLIHAMLVQQVEPFKLSRGREPHSKRGGHTDAENYNPRQQLVRFLARLPFRVLGAVVQGVDQMPDLQLRL